MRNSLAMIILACSSVTALPPKIEATTIKTHPETTFDAINDKIKKIIAEIIAQNDIYKAYKPRTTEYKKALKVASKQLRHNSTNTDHLLLEYQID